MKAEYYRYIDLFVLTRADVYYINGYYLKASLLYRSAYQKALLYNGKLQSIQMGVRNIEKQLNRSLSKYEQNRHEGDLLLDKVHYIRCFFKGYYYAVLKKRLFIY